MVSFQLNTLSIMNCIFGLRKSYEVRSEKSAHPTKNEVSVKGSSLYFKGMTFYFQVRSFFFLVPKKMGSLLIRF